MRPGSYFFALLLGCGAGQAQRPEPIGADDVEIPWSDGHARSGQAPPHKRSEASAETPALATRSKASPVIDFDVKDIDLHDAFRLLAEAADINIVVADTVSGRISLRVQQVPWRKLLQTIVNRKQLMLGEENGIYFVRKGL